MHLIIIGATFMYKSKGHFTRVSFFYLSS
ncbi:hypothetical protein [Lysinibacillus xylanilyticus]